jgi:Cytochrome c2
MRIALFAGTAAALLVAFASMAQAADAEAGKKAFNKCAACHATEKGVTRMGPSLFGVVGRKAGTLEGYKYSAAMQKYDVTWNAETLDAYLTAPTQVVKGTKMTFVGVKNPTERADIIAYLETLK